MAGSLKPETRYARSGSVNIAYQVFGEGDRHLVLVEAHHTAVRTELNRFRGREIDTAGDGFLAAFDGPARGIRAACAVADSVRQLGLDVRAGLHTGERGVMGEARRDRRTSARASPRSPAPGRSSCSAR